MTIALVAASEVTIELGLANSTTLQISDPENGTLFLNPIGSTGFELIAGGDTQLAIGNIPGPAGLNPEFRVFGGVLQYRLVGGSVAWIDLVDLSSLIP